VATAFQRFDQAIRSPYTRPAYHKYLKEFLEYCHKSPDELPTIDFKEIDSLIFDYIVHQKMRSEKGEISPNSFNVIFSPIQLFLEQNDIMINWKKLKRMFPRKKAPSNQSPYTNKDIQKMLNGTTSLRNIAFIHFMASSACRVGAIHTLKVEDMVPVEDGAVVTIYRDDIEEYKTCLTPEAFTAINDYFEFRNMMGFPVRPESSLFCDKSNSKGVTYSNSKDLIRNILNSAGLKRIVKGKTRNGKSQNHAFRKRFETILVNANVHSKYIGYMMGHYEKQDRHYFKPTDKELYQNFTKAIPSLVIDDSIRLQEENKIKEQKIKELKSEKDKRISNLEEKMEQVTKLLELASK